MKKLLARLLSNVLTLAALYLILVNLALNLPATHAYLKSIQPDHLAVTWERAWSLFPLRFELTGLAADGQTRTEQWQVDAQRAAFSVSPLPLLKGEIRLRGLDLADIDLRLRPRPTPEDDHRELAKYFPVIRNRDPSALAESLPDDEGGALVLEIDDFHVTGEHTFWVSQVRGALPGEVRGSLRMDTKAGRLSLAGGALDLALESLRIADRPQLTEGASLKGRVEIPPFTISETRGLEFLRVGELDAQIDLPVQNLDFLTLLMPPARAMQLSGKGRLRGRVVLSKGEMLKGTDLMVEAHELGMGLGPYAFSGDGSVEFTVDPADEAQGDLIVRFDQVRAELGSVGAADEGGPQALFSGRGLTAQLHAAEVDPTTTSTAVRAEELLSDVELTLLLTIQSMEVADLAVYNRLFPDGWDLELLGGAGTVSGEVEVASDTLSLNLDLASKRADLRYKHYRATADLLLQLRAGVDRAAGATLHLDGTSLRIEDAAMLRTDATDASTRESPTKPWTATFRIAEGGLTLPTPAKGDAADPIPYVAKILVHQGFGALIASADGRLSTTLTVTELDWIAELLSRPLELSLAGAGELDAEIVLADGWPTRGTTLRVPRESLSLALMDHRVDGKGTATLHLENGDKTPRLRLAVALEEARLRRRDEPEPSIGEVRMDAEILVANPVVDGAADVTLKIHSARVRDMSSYNAYLPAHAPLSLISGEASLVGDLRFKPDGATGELLLLAEGVRMRVDQEELSGDLRVDLLVRDGSAEDLRFDISGSSVVLDDVRVIGKFGSARAPDWHARLQMEEAEVLWHKPMHLDMIAGIAIKDSRPVVALLDNMRGEHGWIENLLTVRDPGGHLKLALDGKRAVLSDAMIGNEQVSVRAKGRADAHGGEAMVYIRWYDLAGALELRGGEKHFELANARERFDAYAPARAPFASQRHNAKTQGSSAAKAKGPRKPAASTTSGAVYSPKVDRAAPAEPTNPFLNEDL